jgi:hypothetical protein
MASRNSKLWLSQYGRERFAQAKPAQAKQSYCVNPKRQEDGVQGFDVASGRLPLRKRGNAHANFYVFQPVEV